MTILIPPASILNNIVDKDIRKKVWEVISKLNEHFDLDMKMPPIYYDLNGTTAGMFKSKTMSLHFQPKLLMKNYDDFMKDTIPHEVCHLAVTYRHLKKIKEENRMIKFPDAHGSSWKLMMRTLGIAPKVTHSYDVLEIKRKTKQYNYSCACSEPIVVSALVHNKIQKGIGFSCKRCKQSLDPQSWERVLNNPMRER